MDTSVVQAFFEQSQGQKKISKLLSRAEMDFALAHEDLHDAAGVLKRARDEYSGASRELDALMTEFEAVLTSVPHGSEGDGGTAAVKRREQDYERIEFTLSGALRDYRQAMKSFRRALRDLDIVNDDIYEIVRRAGENGCEFSPDQVRAYLSGRIEGAD